MLHGGRPDDGKKKNEKEKERKMLEERTCRNLKGIVDHQGHRGKKIAGLFRREEKKSID